MNSHLKNLGQILKDKRTEKGLSLKTVSEKLKISTQILKAIEEADSSDLPAYVYLRGFILAYSRFLKLNEKEVLKEVQNLKPVSPEESSLSLNPGGFEEEELIVKSQRSFSIFPALGILFVLVLILVVSNIYRQIQNQSQKPYILKEEGTEEESLKEGEEGHPPPQSPPPAVSSSGLASLEVVIKALEEVEFSYRLSENSPVKTITLKPDQFEVLKSRDMVWIETPTSDRIQVFKNGKLLGVFGPGEKKQQAFYP